MERDDPRRESLRGKILSVEWSKFGNPCSPDQTLVGRYFVEVLDATDESQALQATDRLWNLICHQHNAGSSSVPATFILLDLLDMVTPAVTLELLDILLGFARHAKYAIDRSEKEREAWENDLWFLLQNAEWRWERYSSSGIEDHVEWSRMIKDALDMSKPLA